MTMSPRADDDLMIDRYPMGRYPADDREALRPPAPIEQNRMAVHPPTAPSSGEWTWTDPVDPADWIDELVNWQLAKWLHS